MTKKQLSANRTINSSNCKIRSKKGRRAQVRLRASPMQKRRQDMRCLLTLNWPGATCASKLLTISDVKMMRSWSMNLWFSGKTIRMTMIFKVAKFPLPASDMRYREMTALTWMRSITWRKLTPLMSNLMGQASVRANFQRSLSDLEESIAIRELGEISVKKFVVLEMIF